MKVDLRPYQEAAFERAREAIRAGARRILIVAPTGSGKTVLAAALMEMVREKGNRASFVVDRISLIDQSSDTFDRYGLEHGVIQGGHMRWAPYHPLQLCSVQTLARRRWPESQVDIFDEAHVLHKTHKSRMEQGNSLVVGLTATPFTRGLGKWFDAVINVTTTRALIESQWLAPYRIFSCAEPDMKGVRLKNGGEWDETESSAKAMEVVGDVVAEYIKHGEDRKFICSAVDTKHVEELARQFQAAGINVATYTYKDREEDRADITREFRKPNSQIRGLITVTAASRGFDVPDVSCVIMARPLRKSLAEHIQLFGRGLRIAPGKADCLVLDHSGNCARFFDSCESFFDQGLLELDTGKKRERKQAEKKPVEPVKCPHCRALHYPAPECPSCGHQYPKKEAIRHVPGTLKELIAGGYRKELTRTLWPMVCAYARTHRPSNAKSAALAIFRDMTGSWPADDFDRTASATPSQEVLNRIKASQIRWRKGQKTEQRSAA